VFETFLSFLEEKKKLIRDFDEKQQEANETVRTDEEQASPCFFYLVLVFSRINAVTDHRLPIPVY
jgi:hypothetical protein